MERRKPARRHRKRVEVRYGPRQPDCTGYSGNISRTGMMLRCIRVFPPGTLLQLELKFPDEVLRATATVTWAREGTVQLLSTGRVGMGLRFVELPDQLLGRIGGASGPSAS